MRKISRHPHRFVGFCALFIAVLPGSTWADDNHFYQNHTQYGVALPNTSLPMGADEVRGADGTSCRSAVGGDGAYVDTGIIGSPGQDGSEFSGAVYTRLVVPLGGRPKRLNCTSLYELEIQRLRMELDLARMGLSGQESSRTNWQEGWSSEGAGQKPATAAQENVIPPKKVAETAALAVVPLPIQKPAPAPTPAADTPIAANLVVIGNSIY